VAKKNSAKIAAATATSSANLGFESKLWLAADKLRGTMDSGEYKHVVLGLLFLKYISDAFEELHSQLKEGKGEFKGSDAEDADEYSAHNVFWVPKSARWASLQAKAKQPDIGKLIDDAMVAIEKDNPRLKGVLPKDYARPAIDQQRLGELIDLLASIGLGSAEHRGKDMLGRVYEYTRRLAIMNLAIRGIEADIGQEPADTFRRDLHKDLKADFIIANPPFNISDWSRDESDVRWKYGIPPKGNANFGWVQHIIHHLAPTGMAGFVLANGSMSSNQSGEGDIRKSLVENDLVDCMVAMPGQLFYSTQIPVCLWFLTRNKNDGKRRDRRKETLFIDARKMGTLIDRVHRELNDDDLLLISSTYHAWRGEKGAGKYADVAGFCKSATTAEIAAHGHVLTPGRFVGAEEVADDGDPFEEKMPRLVAELHTQFAESAKLEQAIKANMKGLGYGG
jgi:type I restriction-modification system DNA methylase subunit